MLLFVCLLVAALAGAPVGTAPSAPPVPTASAGIVETTLGNGMRVILLPNRLAPVATVAIEYGVGSNDDTLSGVAHATEHMMYRGTSDVSAAQFSDIADRMGAEYNATTENEFTYYYFKLPSAYVATALHLEADRMTRASMRGQDWATERKAIEQEVRAHESVPGYKIGVKLNKLFLGDSVLARPVAGTVASFEKMTAVDIAQFYHAWYHPNNATAIVSGDIDTTAVMTRIHALFDDIPSAPLPAHVAVTLQPLASATVTDSIDLPISLSALMYRTPGAADPAYAATVVLNQALNSGRGQFADLTASGKILLTLNLSGTLPEVGTSFVMGIPPPNGSPGETAKLLSGVLASYRASGVPPELVAASELGLLSERASEQASISGWAFEWVGTIGQRQVSPASVYDAIANVTDDDVNRVLRTYYTPDHQITAALSPKPFSALPSVDSKAATENVRYTPSKVEPLPAWAAAELNVPLKVPENRASDVVAHLPNGMTVVIRSESMSPTVVVKGEIKTDPQLYEPRGREGVAGLTSGLMSYGTSTYDRTAYQTQLDAIAAKVSLNSSFSVTSRSENFDRALELLADGLLHPAFPQAGFDVLRTQAVTLSAAGEKLPATQASIAETDALYPPGDPRRRRSTPKSFQAVSLADVRRWYAFAFRPDLTTIAIVGNVPASQARAAVSRYFGSWKAIGKKPTFRYPVIASRRTPGETITVKSPSAVQSQVTLKQVVHLHRGDPDFVPLLLANTMLSGEGTGSLLFKELRTRDGYVYSVDSDLDVADHGATFSITYASDPKNVNRAEAAAIAIVKHMQRTPFAAVELQRAKALLIAARVLPLDSYGGIATHLLVLQINGVTTQDSNAFWAAVRTATPHDVQLAVLHRLHPDRFLRVVVAPE